MRLPYRLHAGSWQPARLRRPDYQLILVGLVCAAYIRGFDYLVGRDRWAARDFMLAAAPEWVWGGGFLIGAVFLGWGLVRRLHLFVWLGHGWLAIAYGVNALALAFASGPVWLILLLGAAFAVATAALLRLPILFGSFISVAALAAWTLVAWLSGEWLDGVRGSGATFVVAALHGIYHLRTGISPIRPDEKMPAEVIVSEGS